MVYKYISYILLKHIIYCEIFNLGIEQPVNPESRDWRILSGIVNASYDTLVSYFPMAMPNFLIEILKSSKGKEKACIEGNL